MAAYRSSTIAIPAISALVGGAVGALLTVSLMRGNVSRADIRASRQATTEPPQPSESSVAIEARVASLERSLRALALKDSVARAASPADPAGTGPAAPAPATNVAPLVDNPVFDAAVRDVMDRAEQERNLERETQRAEWRKRTAEEWGSKLGEKLRLTEIQKAKATAIAQSFWDRLRELRQADAGPPLSRDEWRDRVATLRKTSEAELAQILDHSQLTSYGELDEADKLGSPRSIRAAQRAIP
jgi:hypothetical protein